MTAPSTTPKPLAITQGDPAGIGPETIAKAFRDAPDDLRGCFVVGDLATLRRAAQCVQRPGQPSLPVALLTDPAQVWSVPPRCLPVWQLPGLRTSRPGLGCLFGSDRYTTSVLMR